MRIAIDATTLCDSTGGPGAGIEHYTWSMLLSLLRLGEGDAFTVVVPDSINTKRASMLHMAEQARLIKLRRSRIPFLSRHLFLPMRLNLRRTDVLFAPSGQLPYAWNGRSVITVHDASIFENPEWFPDGSADNFATKKNVPRSIERADRIIAVSEATKNQLQRVFPDAVHKISVIHEAVSPPEPLPTLSTRFQSMLNHVEDLILFVGTIEPRKNLLNALHAFHRFLEIHPQRARITRFLIAGKFGWKTEDVEAAIRDVNQVWQRRAGGNVVQAGGYVTEAEKWALLAQASVLMSVSLEEGFGLPLLEAMSVGTPVIASKIPAHEEIGGEAVFYVDQNDPEAIALTIAQCLLVPDALRLIQNIAKKRAAQFSWEKAAMETLKVIHEVGKKKEK